MKSARICLLSLACVSGAVAFGVVANAAIDMVMPAAAPAVTGSVALPPDPSTPIMAATDEGGQAAPGGFALASATSTPVDLGPVKVKTIPMVYREPAEETAAASAQAPVRAAAVPLPRPRPAIAPASQQLASIAPQSAQMAIATATKAPIDENDPLSPASIDRIKTALALTSEQETYWPAVAAELKAIAKAQPHKHGVKKGQAAKIDVDPDTAQRLYWAAAPLITRLSYDQKKAVKQIALSMGLQEVAEAL
ncbi:MAG: hypothetical protein V7604_2898 [Hyphomicrobiales bacterium]